MKQDRRTRLDGIGFSVFALEIGPKNVVLDLRLFVLFIPVIFTSPIILVGPPSKEYKGDRWGAVWWYGYLVQQMEAAGPTFIKVSLFFPSTTI